MFGEVEQMTTSDGKQRLKVLIVGAGRMGMRHCIGVLALNEVALVIVTDLRSEAIEAARTQFSNKGDLRVEFILWDELIDRSCEVDLVILATTPSERVETCKALEKFSPRFFLIEKPLGQSLEQVEALCRYFGERKQVTAFVNLNTRLYPSYQKLKKDLEVLPQFKGPLSISINTGTVGIGANGIHYVDLLKFLTGAVSISVLNASINEDEIPSGRGGSFSDFGGYAILDYLDTNEKLLARAYLVLNSHSTAIGPWEILGCNGRVSIDELEQTRRNKLRKTESTLPVQRYAADYLQMETEEFRMPLLQELTEVWLKAMINGDNILPTVEESYKVHKVLFEWLGKAKNYQTVFPIA
jgi:predicted dehydrogenase